MDWLVTASTLFCDIIDDWVTIMVYPEDSPRCSHFVRYGTVKGVAKGKQHGEIPECTGPADCALCKEYKEEVFRRDAEAAKGSKV